jgi:branched-subunit amino acid transport protein AzlD
VTLTPLETLVIIGVVAASTIITRFLPFLFEKQAGGGSAVMQYFGRVLPYSAVGMLVVYCLKEVVWTAAPFGFPEIFSIAVIAALHWWKGNSLLSIGVGTVLYMTLVQTVFVK